MCPDGLIWQPTPGTSFYWNLTPNISTSTVLTAVETYHAQVLDLDLFYVTPEIVEMIHSMNRTLICYIDTAYEDYRPDAYMFPASVLGNDLDGWQGERWVDITSPIVRGIMQDRLQKAVALGCDAIEWDDVDAWENGNGLGLGPNDQLNFNLFLANITHAANLSAGLKNDIDQIYVLDDYFDWALDEQCWQYSECNTLQPFIYKDKAVFGAEYKGTASKICNGLNGMNYSFIRTDLNVDGTYLIPCCQYENPPCPLKPYRCARPPGDYPIYPEDTTAGALRTTVSLFALFLSLFIML